MKIGLICSNLFNIDKNNKTGTGIFNYSFIKGLKNFNKNKYNFTVFASGQSDKIFKIKSVGFKPSSDDEKIIKHGKHIMYELALIGKAFSEQAKFDLFHVNIGDGDLVMPFLYFVEKPVLITLHHIYNEDHTRKYFSLFKNNKNVYFVSASNSQRKILPRLNYIGTVHHGIDTEQFGFNSKGGKGIMWSGRLIPEKGPDTVIKIAQKNNRSAKLFGVIKGGYEEWYKANVAGLVKKSSNKKQIKISLNYPRHKLIKYYQTSKVFLSPILADEAFGLVFVEALSCGTPVVTFARGSAEEVIKDGQTGFLVNPSGKDIRGDFIIKKTGAAGLSEAIEKIYGMSSKDYNKMRLACRQSVLDKFSTEKMIDKYFKIYKKIGFKNKSK